MTDATRHPKKDVDLPLVENTTPPSPGKGFKIGPYVISESIGPGATATVYLAIDASGHETALKIFLKDPGMSQTMIERFHREANASKKLRRHPHILTISETGKDGPYHYLAMNFSRKSKTFDDAMKNTPMSLNRIVQIIIRIARALQYAHIRHMIHRDVKPTNILIDEFGEPLLSDFGMAELIDWQSVTTTGAWTGTPLYLSPEQARGERAGPASDIYSLGVVLYEAITGILPYNAQRGSPVKDVLDAVKNEPPKRPRLFRQEISPELEAVMLKSLEKNPKDRYADAEAFAVDLERALAGRRVSAHRFSPIDYFRHLARRRQRMMLMVAPWLLFAGGVALYYRHIRLNDRYEDLLTRARLKNALTQADGGNIAIDTPRAWREIRLARKAMTAGDWTTARDGFHSARELSMTIGDARTAAIAELDEARCDILVNNRADAKKLYDHILKNSDASIAIVCLAQLEYLSLLLLEGNRTGAKDILTLRDPPADKPIRDALNCLVGETSATELASAVERMPHPFQSDAYLAAAIRCYFDGETKRAAIFLKQCMQSSASPSEWPAPFAKLLHNDLNR
jgi:hypothetical protein